MKYLNSTFSVSSVFKSFFIFPPPLKILSIIMTNSFAECGLDNILQKVIDECFKFHQNEYDWKVQVFPKRLENRSDTKTMELKSEKAIDCGTEKFR